MSNLADSFQIGIDVTGSKLSDKTKQIMCQTGDVKGHADADNVTWMQHVGFASRPADVGDGESSAQAVVIRQGGRDVCIASHDRRTNTIYGTLAPGETCVFAGGADGEGQARIILKADGSVTMYSKKGNVLGGAGMQIQLDAANGVIRLMNDLGHGLIIDEEGVKLYTNGGGSLKITGGGDISLAGSGAVMIDGGSITLAPMPGVGAIPAIGNVLHGPTGIAGAASTKVFVGL